MSTNQTTNIRWQDRRSLVYAWLLLFFPVGLYGLWTSRVFEDRQKWQFSAAVAVVLVVGSAGLINLLVGLVGAPLAVFLLWRDPEIARPTFRNFAIGAGVVALLALASAGGGGGFGGDGDCSAVMEGSSGTYFRDSDCNVFAVGR